MDSSDIGSNLDLSKLSQQDKVELQAFAEKESQKAQIQQSVHSLTDLCWTKCVKGAIKSNSLDRGEESCMRNCVDRFLDSNGLVLKHLQSMRQ